MTKDKIIRIVADDLAKYGIKVCRMHSVASSYHVSKKTLYKYFGSKENMIRECLVFSISQYNEQIKQEEMSASSSLGAILLVNRLALQQALRFCPAFYSDIKRFTELCQMMDAEYISHVHETYLRQFKKGAQQGIFITDNDWMRTLNFFDDQIYNMCQQTTTDIIRRIDNYAFTVMTYLNGVCTDKGRDELKAISPKLFHL